MANINFMQNISRSLQKLGSGLMQTGMTSVVLRNANHCCGRSIFGFGAGPAMMYGGMGITPQMLADPMGISWLPNPSLANAANNAYGNALAYQWGRSLAAGAAAQNMNNPIQQLNMMNMTMPGLNNNTATPKTDAKYAGDIDKNQSIEQGKKVDEATDKMGDGENTEAKIVSLSDPTNLDKSEQEYKTQLSELGKSYGAMIDSQKGNTKDGKVTMQEYINHELSKLDSKTNSYQKAEAVHLAQTAFNKIDQNGDGYADWKELAATMATFDSDSQSRLDGSIKAEDFQRWSGLLSNAQSNEFDTMARANYKQLFGDGE